MNTPQNHKAASMEIARLQLNPKPVDFRSHPALSSPNTHKGIFKQADIFAQVRNLGPESAQMFAVNSRNLYLVCLSLASGTPKKGALLQYALSENALYAPEDAVWIDFGPLHTQTFTGILPFPVPVMRVLVWDGDWVLQVRKTTA